MLLKPHTCISSGSDATTPATCEACIDARARNPEHYRLLDLMLRRPEDYQPWGNVDREALHGGFGPDCSWGCKFFRVLDGDLGADWGVCTNPASHRVGLLTFEHQGCQKFEVEMRRCKVTGNLCGTDTWAVGKPCQCDECQEWCAENGIGVDDEDAEEVTL